MTRNMIVGWIMDNCMYFILGGVIGFFLRGCL